MSGIELEVIKNRHDKLSVVLENAGLKGIALNPGSSLTYLTGLHFHLSERPVVFLFQVDGPPVLVLPELESQKLESRCNGRFENVQG